MATLQQGMATPQQIEESMKPFREFLTQYNRITEKCFNDCISDFTTKNILNSENSCSLNCLEKTLKTTQRISERFQEHQMLNVDDPTAAAMQTMGK
ncbi:mitochondrial import inner membrane translocase subunit Tim9-like [Ruditapes philippinarum]|uniref:mitochondrial import inner membrane translocase subunit Tim9-like n=1 Tax=Ruditapes philippinarum TaxID=129788 RepID=UPI00295AEC69|nr:mitochondrial import inner membrane translocase subunit Tim9-like [Ruditapes philippinarum]